MDSVELSIIIPAYQEAEALQLLLPQLKSHVARLSTTSEILVVDTESSLDETESVCRQNAVTHLRRHGKSYGDAVRTGLAHATGSSILFMDADGSHNPADIQRLWQHRQAFVIVIGSRYVKGGTTENPYVLILLSYIVNLIFRLVFALSCKDVSNSFRLYRAAALKAIPIQSDNFDLIPEILIKLSSQYGSSCALEVPITFEQRKKGKSKRNLFAFAITYIRTIVRLRLLLNEYLKHSKLEKSRKTKAAASQDR